MVSKKRLAQHIVGIADASFQMEHDRYESLLSSSGRLLTCISISIVALTALLPVVCQAFPGCSMLLGVEFLCVVVLVIGAFICALVAQFRFKYSSLRSPSELAQFIIDTQAEYENDLDIAQNYADNLEGPFLSAKKRNNRITRLLIACSILLWVALGVSVILAIVDVVVIFA